MTPTGYINCLIALSVRTEFLTQIDPPTADDESEQDKRDGRYDVDRFVEDAFALKISSFMLDQYAEEYEEMLRTRNAHVIEMDALRNSNRNLSAQVCVLYPFADAPVSSRRV